MHVERLQALAMAPDPPDDVKSSIEMRSGHNRRVQRVFQSRQSGFATERSCWRERGGRRMIVMGGGQDGAGVMLGFISNSPSSAPV